MPANGTPSNVEVLAELRALTSRLDAAAADAREGRDLARSIKDTLTAQDMPARLEALRGEMNAGFQGARADLVNAQAHIRSELSDHEKRIKALEDLRTKADGVTGLMGWIAKHAPWLFAGIAAFVGGLGWRGHLPPH
jgi:hypothetical protein